MRLLTGGAPGYTESGGCFLGSEIGELVADPTYGTVLEDDAGNVVPVMWKPGFRGARVGSEVLVLEPFGNVVATTGRRSLIDGRYWGVEHDPAVLQDPHAWMGAGARPADRSQLEIPTVFVACGDVFEAPGS